MDATSTLLNEIYRTWPRSPCCQKAQTVQLARGAWREGTGTFEVRTVHFRVLLEQQGAAHLGLKLRQGPVGVTGQLVSADRRDLGKLLERAASVQTSPLTCDRKASLRGELAAVGSLSLERGIQDAPLAARALEPYEEDLRAHVHFLRYLNLPRSAARLALRPGVPLSRPRKQTTFARANGQRSRATAAELVPLLRGYLLTHGSEVPESLRAVAEVRIEHPHLPLSALAQLAETQMSKDAYAGRLRRVVALAKEWEAKSRVGLADTDGR